MQISSRFDDVLDGIIDDNFEKLPEIIAEIKALLDKAQNEELEENTIALNNEIEEDTPDFSAQIEDLLKRVSVLEKLKSPSRQAREQSISSAIWDF